MNIIRYNTFRRMNFFNKDSFFLCSHDFRSDFTDYRLKKETDKMKEKIKGKHLIQSKYNIIKTFPDKKTVIINTLYDSIVVLTEDESAIFNNHSDMMILNDCVVKLYMLGMLIDKHEDEEFIMQMQNEELVINRKGIPSITILPTQVCNARCAYCFAEHNEKITMNNQTIREVIDFIKNNFNKGDQLLLRWFGGEPLVAVDVIDKIIDGINTSFDGELQYESLLFTNGSLITDEIILMAKKKWHLNKIQLTLDGYGDEHNKRKSYITKGIDYYKKTLKDIQKLIDSGISVDCRVNFDKDNIGQIDEILKDLLPYKGNELFRVRLTILRPSDCGYNEFNYITPSDLKWAYSIIYNKLYQFGFLKAVKDLIPQRQKESCIAKSMNKIIIGADGNIYKCLQEVFDEVHIVGNLNTGISKDGYLTYCRKSFNDECKGCVYLPICSGGCYAYWKLKEMENITPCIREKYFIDLLLDMVHDWEYLK